MNRALETLKERGFISQCTDLEGLSALMDREPVTVYLGADPTAKSLHIGHMVPFYALSHLRRAGANIIALMGGGTGRIGDPSGKTEMRKLLSYEELNANVTAIAAQLSGFFTFNGREAVVENNAAWLADLNYIDFLRDIGRHFSVNKMLSFESYKRRLETGLSFIEFNYQLLQSYDFYQLYKRNSCRLQIGGDDQWGNIVAGIDLIRRMGGEQCYGLTAPLITTADGKKMGKSEKGAIFLAADLTSVYDFYQYWRNVADADVERFALLFTFLSVSECRALGAAQDQAINKSKEILAYEVTKIIHGEAEAEKAQVSARALFSGESTGMESAPHALLTRQEWDAGVELLDLLVKGELCASRGAARRLIEQGAVSVNGEKIEDSTLVVDRSFIKDDVVILRVGKKRHFLISFTD